jgi:hypothetical protein
VTVQFGGADQLAAFSRRAAQFASAEVLVDAAEEVLTDEVPVIERAASRRAISTLPRSGGLSTIVAALRLGPKITRRRDEVRVRMRVLPKKNLLDPNSVNRGRLWHPTYGREPNVVQYIPAGWFTLTVLEHRKEFYDKMQTRLARAYRKL